MSDTIWTGLMILAAFIILGLHEWRKCEKKRRRAVRFAKAKERQSKPINFVGRSKWKE